MDFATRRKRSGLGTVPMINLVFLLLIFFLLTAQITPTALLDVTPPEAVSGDRSEQLPTILMDGEGRVAFEDAFGREAALARLEAEITRLCADRDCTADPLALTLRADAASDGQSVARLIGEIAALGPVSLTLATVGQ